MDTFEIKRDGLPPIVFKGEEIATASSKTNSCWRWTNVEIYRSKGGRYICCVDRISCVDGERTSRAATSCVSPEEVIAWLKEGADQLGAVSQRAVEQAAKTDPAFAAAWVEEVE